MVVQSIFLMSITGLCCFTFLLDEVEGKKVVIRLKICPCQNPYLSSAPTGPAAVTGLFRELGHELGGPFSRLYFHLANHVPIVRLQAHGSRTKS
jgi:hypothetical protein